MSTLPITPQAIGAPVVGDVDGDVDGDVGSNTASG